MMRESGVPPDTITYNSLIKVAGNSGRLPDAVALYSQLKAEGLAPSLVTYTALFTAAAQARQGDAAWLFEASCRGAVQHRTWGAGRRVVQGAGCRAGCRAV